jgi:hypothetical protein
MSWFSHITFYPIKHTSLLTSMSSCPPNPRSLILEDFVDIQILYLYVWFILLNVLPPGFIHIALNERMASFVRLNSIPLSWCTVLSIHLLMGIFLFIYLFTCAYIVWVISSPCPPPPTFLPPLFSFRQVLFCPYKWFC